METIGQSEHQRVQGQFALFVDEELRGPEKREFLQHLDDCEKCETSFKKYERAVQLVRGMGREKAPIDFASRVMKRVRRRRKNVLFGLQGGRYFEHISVPVEAAIPVLLAALVAAVLIFAAP